MTPLLSRLPLSLAIASAISVPLISHAADAETVELDVVTVNADFRDSELNSIPASISVVDSESIDQRNAQHLEDVLALIPNVNYAAGASRGRYFQIRGVGERSQFVAPLNPSVGTYVDGIDFTGVGGAATLIDVEQVEVLRGSQGTRFGANSLAGVISVKSVEPSAESKGYVKAHGETYNGYGLEAAHGGAISDTVLYRAAVGKKVSDGYIENTTLDKKNTNNIDELTSRLKLRWLAGENLTLDFSALYLDIDNGYDAFSFDENRKTKSNEPGHDRQESKALALDSNWKISNAVSMQSILTSNRTDSEYGFDEDWSGLALQPDYQVFDNYERDIKRDSVELRWLSGSEGRIANSDWLVGVYYQDAGIDLVRERTGKTKFTSDYETNSASLFAELNTSIQDNLVLTSGLRLENWKSDYSDSNNISGDNDENLVGGKLALEYTLPSSDLLYTSITRGYKAGGFNGDQDLPSENVRSFDTEYQWNYEIGGKFSSLQNRLNNRVSVFYTDRKDLQLKSSTPVSNSNGEFLDYIANAGKGFSYGLEWEMNWQIAQGFDWSTSLGLLKTEITEHDNSDPDAFDLKGRDAAHAPEYNYATAISYALTHSVSMQLGIEGKDGYFYSDSHNFKSKSYNLVNARIAYHRDNYELALYGKNITDEEYGVRGFDFGDYDADPRSGEGFDETQFQQLGAPAVFGISARVDI